MKISLMLGATVTVGSLLCLPARAETWSITAATAALERTSTTIKTTPFFDKLSGAGVHFLSGMTGRAVMYLPVTVPDGTVLRSMGFRVGGVAAGTVKAELYQQPNQQPIGKVLLPVRLGALRVTDKSSAGPLVFWTGLTEHAVDNFKYTYLVRVELCKDPDLKLYPAAATDAKYDTKLFSVTVGDVRCHPTMMCGPDPPPPPERPCRAF